MIAGWDGSYGGEPHYGVTSEERVDANPEVSFATTLSKTKRFKTKKVFLLYMGLLNKLMFWKKEEEFDFEGAAAKEMSRPKGKSDEFGYDYQNPALEEKSAFPDSFSSASSRDTPSLSPATLSRPTAPDNVQRDLELISSKLDTLKAMLGSLEQRLGNIEKAAGVEQKRNLW